MADLESPTVMNNIITFLSSLLQRVAESNDLNPRFHPQKISAFHGLTRPTISIQSYLERIFKYANCSPSCYVVAYVYLDRFTQQQPALSINSFNVHRLLITGVMVAAKFMDDLYYNNAYYAKVGGISTTEMNFLEVDFLFGLGFQLNVNPTTFHTYFSHLQREMLLIQPPLDHHNLNLSPSSSSSSLSSSPSSSYKSISTKLLHYEDDHQQHQEVAAV
ncbi:putative cyclin PHO80, Cyclin-like superfamily [Helianthus annuus]|uniref:Cyclin n=1 Tax=Helianthus annuus TaxID=4232 RepID=A0A9K3GZ31_HELAN|nr:cyclin-U4-1 [Helianthus annuus]KAF5761247.1 putative cyclin PHO80, Cyclin-like superfamily [Helianthus annuus]KAJ0439145.1 putative cyclin PHO80, Cyclin-like superfamily [Helianthus annuus]KAJ0444137.1 putative cyclin PHO80, Cyclin-like superfamily [Helianthus annuus]KAJ0461492.1 putative cyclin PHO80, Cyclin-like superfamily [Helianthus annuus]KAJ0641914.1 putative cyclin PHO80, Cyclin-like superfamily [Helianthus annuus]